MKNLIASIIFALGFIMIFILVLPQFDAIGVAKTNNSAKQALLDGRAAELSNFKSLDREAKLRQADINKIIVFLPAKKQIDELVSSIQKVSGDSGMQMINITTSVAMAANEEAGYKTININLDLAGQYPSFVSFLKMLEQSLRLYDISEITAGVTTGGTTGTASFSVKINAYYLK